jgi:hypothetical protein
MKHTSGSQRTGDETRRRLARIAVVGAAIVAFGAAGISGALAQDDDIFGDDWPFPSGGAGIFGDDWPFPTGGTGGDINVGGGSGGTITVGSGGSGDISIGGVTGGIDISGGNSGSGSGGGGGNSGSGGGYDD